MWYDVCVGGRGGGRGREGREEGGRRGRRREGRGEGLEGVGSGCAHVCLGKDDGDCPSYTSVTSPSPSCTRASVKAMLASVAEVNHL